MNIPGPLLDRMEVIRIPGYTEDEKLNIAQRYLTPKQTKLNGLKPEEMSCRSKPRWTLFAITRARQACARSSGRSQKCAEKWSKAFALGELKPGQAVTPNASDVLGVRKFNFGTAEKENKVGQVTGLAWTSVGGRLLTIEVASTMGKGRVVKTGSLGDVMQESIQAAITVVRAKSQALGIAAKLHDSRDMHIHVPEGATPKDGPSAGIAMCTALVSSFTDHIPVRSDVAMTGEITLRGEVLPIGGLKEKLLAAKRGGIETVIIPHENERDLQEVPDNIKENVDIRPVKWIDEVLSIALERLPEALDDDAYLEGMTPVAQGEDAEADKTAPKRPRAH